MLSFVKNTTIDVVMFFSEWYNISDL